MRGYSTVAAVALVGSAVASPITPVHPKGAKSIVITHKNTLNATAPPPKGPQPKPSSTENLPCVFTNNFSGGSLTAWISGLDTSGALVFVQTDGSFYYPTCDASTGVPQPITGDISIPMNGQGQNTSVTVQGYVNSGRFWFGNGDLQFFTVCSASGLPSLVTPASANPSDPSADINYSFSEFTNLDSGLYADISYVDLVGLPLGVTMVAGDGSLQTAYGVPSDAVSTLCGQLQSQASSDGQPWGDLCQSDSSGNVIRAIAPQDYISSNPSAFSDYWTDYVNSVWSYFETNTLTVNTQASAGDVTCQVSNGQLSCAGDNVPYSQPDANDIFGCNTGPFSITGSDNSVHAAVVPRLCAAFDRSTFLISGGSTQPDGVDASAYYSVSPTNYWSKFIHEMEVDGKGYAFPYDDVTPDGGVNQAGVVTDASPQQLQFIVGGPL